MLLLFLTTLFCSKSSIGEEYRITSTKDFSAFIKDVNGGADYSGTTVYLDSDLTPSEETPEPIGKYLNTNHFRGTFDGQGHVFKDFRMNSSSSQYTGLFGYSGGLSIKNVVLDSSCTMASSYSGTETLYVGGIIGHCHANSGECTIENSVNIGGVAFSGDTESGVLYLGGVIGCLTSSSSYDSKIKNCANYGPVTHNGETYSSFVGGIAGSLEYPNTKYIHNCLNHGAITHSGTTLNESHIGGITGYSYYAEIKNCMNDGQMSTQGAPSTSYIGSLVGYVYSDTSINYCYYTGDSTYEKYGYTYTTPIESNTPETPTGASAAVDNLNSQVTSDNNWDRWLLNANSKGVTFNVNSNAAYSLSSGVVLLPSLASGWRSFVGWYSDSAFTISFSSSAVSEDTTLYGRWNMYMIKLDATGGSVSSGSKTVTYDSEYGELPTPTRTGYSFNGWFAALTGGTQITSSTKVISTSDHTLYAHWTGNSYTVSFDANGGSVSSTSKTATYDSEYGELPTPTRTGYSFNGWHTEKEGGTQVLPSTKVTSTFDHTLYARWTVESYTVSFDANGGSVSQTSKTVTYDSEYGELPTPTRTGYSFSGWHTALTGGTQITSSTKVISTSDHTLYAHWTANNSTVSFDANGGSVSPTSKTVTYDSEYGELPTPTRIGYSFNGWYTEKEGGTQVLPSTKVTSTSDHTLYARWTVESYTVTFNVNGGSVSQTSKTVTYDSEYGELPTPTRTGYSFNGWYTALTGGTQITSSTKVTSTSDHEIYAHWTINKYTVKFVFNNDDDDEVRTLDFNQKIDYPKDVQKEGSTFSGWNDTTEYMPAYNLVIAAVWKSEHIASLSDFKDFINFVNTGSDDYRASTVFLDADLSLSDIKDPIGKDPNNKFCGVFDGQGYIISDLKITSSSVQYAGLFGYSTGLIIRNVVLDPSCSVTSSYESPTNLYAGGIIGNCQSTGKQCVIENIVNMATTTFSGKTESNYLYFGGIVGYLCSSQKYSAYVKNCANYGPVTHSGTSKFSYVGGIAGYVENSNSIYKYVYNCFNYGTITHSGTTSTSLYAGGIAGGTSYAYIENCVSTGIITDSSSAGKTSNIGILVGQVSSYTHVNYCYYADKLTGHGIYGTGEPESTANTLKYFSTTFKLEQNVSTKGRIGDSLVDALNVYSDYYILRGYSHWLLNRNSKSAAFTINGRTNPIKMSYQVILLPSLANEMKTTFDGWYENSGLTHPLGSFEITNDVSLYSKFGDDVLFTVTFDTRGGASVAPQLAQFDSEMSLPSDLTRDDCAIAFWETAEGFNVGFALTMPARDITLYAVWKCLSIKTADDFAGFSKIVNSGTDDFSGTTVLLDSDLSLPDVTDPIGEDCDNYFRGVFDGQGHTISDLRITSSSSHCIGLLGYTRGLTVRNVVINPSCTVLYPYSGYDNIYAGSVVGYCDGQCSIENSVNMAGVAFSGDISKYSLYLGGIAGRLYSHSNSIFVRNCANYGSVRHSGTSTYSYIGGISGSLDYSNSYYNFLYNSLNYGPIAHDGTTSDALYLGGIAGYSYYTHIKNCVSAGNISTQSTPSTSYIGSVIGHANSYTRLDYCYHSDDLSDYSQCGKGSPASASNTFSYDKASFKLSGNVSVGSYSGDSLIGALNAYSDYYFLRDYSNWLLNQNSNSVLFTINSRTNLVSMSYQIILLPSLASEGGVTFDGWYDDSKCTNPLKTFEVIADTKLYGKFEENTNNYVIAFDTRGGSAVASRTAQFGTIVALPSDLTRDDCTVAFWENGYGEYVGLSFVTPTHNVVLYAVWKCTRIATPGDFVDFSKIVNKGNDYHGTTVLLGSDLSLSEVTEQVGTSSSHFRGVFDGQGHVISDLVTASSSTQYAGLFGYSAGLTVRNVVLDSSCSVTSSYSGSSALYAGGIIGYCRAENEECVIENNVNMADVTFSGDVSKYSLYLGGIAGYVSSSNRDSHVKNCANYGSVTHSGNSSYSYIGGVVGDLGDTNYANPYYKYIYNCLSYGTITHSGTTTNALYLGGIAGRSYYTYIENCVSAGEISTQSAPGDSFVGSVVGHANSFTYIKYCYYASGIGAGNPYARGSPAISEYSSYDGASFELAQGVSIKGKTETSLVDALNAAAGYYGVREYSNWLVNKDNNPVTFVINGRTSPIAMGYQVILLPSLATEGTIAFSGWYEDNEYTSKPESFEIMNDTELYGRFEENTNNYTVSFDTRREGISAEPITARFGAVVSLPSDLTKDYCSVAFWENKYGDNVGFSLAMPARNFTLYAVWKCTYIATTDDFIDFSKVVNSGTYDFSATTVYLDSDLSLSGETPEPIGKYSNTNHFRGTFDGQGHVFKDFRMNSSSSQYTGLFGYSGGLSIKNVVLDSSCTMASSYSGTETLYVGGIIGHCHANSGECTIENSVNIGGVAFSGDTESGVLYLGGVIGYLYSSQSYKSYVKNCANYGPVTHNGETYSSFVGGIAGSLEYPNTKYIHNCLNHGAITHSGTTLNILYVGGITGYSYHAEAKNCMNDGQMSTQGAPSTSYIGSLVGYVYSDTSINYCYYTGDVAVSNKYGHTYSIIESNTPETPTGASAAVGNLNSQVTSDNNWDRWLLNANSKGVTFNVNSNAAYSLSSGVVLLPSLASGWRSFVGWYSDSAFTTSFSSSTVSEDTTLYGRWNMYMIKLDATGGSTSETSINTMYNNEYGTLPTPTRTGYSFNGWYTALSGGTQVSSSTKVTTASDHTLYAHWTGNSYTVSFDANGGSESYSPRSLIFGSEYGELPTPTRTGYSFNGWHTEKSGGTLVTKDSDVNIASDHTLYAHWAGYRYTVAFEMNWDGYDSNISTSKDVVYGSPYGDLPAPPREGYTLNGWFTEDGVSVTSETPVAIMSNHTLHARWTINNYILCFYYYEEKVKETSTEFNATIKYPKGGKRKGYKFSGWDNNITNMPAYNLTIKAQWTESRSEDVLAVLTTIAAVVICIILVASTILAIVIILMRRRKNGRLVELDKPLLEKKEEEDPVDGYTRVVATMKDEVESKISTGVTRSILTQLYPRDYTRPTMRDALIKAELTDAQADLICNACKNVARYSIKEKGDSAEGLTEEDAASIAMYTYDFGEKDFESNPYRIINISLVKRNYAALQKVSDILYLVMTALRKLPRYTGKTLYRGVKNEVKMDEGYYFEGNVVTWPALSSTSPDMEETKRFLAKGSADGKAVGTLFIIEDGWGYDVQPYSLFPDEAEILLEPERQFEVVSVAPADDLTVITLKMLGTPLSLPDVFGGVTLKPKRKIMSE